MNTTSHEKRALIIGASRGIGLGLVCKYLDLGWSVVATERQPSATTDLGQLTAENAERLSTLALDINHPEQLNATTAALQNQYFDLLFVVAGITDDPSQLASQISNDEFQHVFVTNALSPIRVLEALLPKVTADGTVAVMSSALGSIAGNIDGGYETYRASKAALNSLLRSFAARQKDARTYIAMMPGWVQTDMGGPDAPVTIQQSVDGMTNTLASHDKAGGSLFIDFQGNVIAW